MLRPALPVLLLVALACGGRTPEPETSGDVDTGPGDRTGALLLVTLDTTRADAMGWENPGVETPSLEALAERGRVFRQAYTTAPTTLPAHVSMMTGLYPAEHGIHENSRYLEPDVSVLAERLSAMGYHTAAFVSGLPLAGRFGLGRGFTHYDDEVGTGGERDAATTTERALTHLSRHCAGDFFLWVHYFDPHEPYAPPEPYASRHPDAPYLAEIEFMDHHVGRLVDAFEDCASPRDRAVLVAGDHGEALGDHGEERHGNLLYQGVMRVPLLITGSDIEPGTVGVPVSVRHVFDTLLELAGDEREASLLEPADEVVLGEAMKPFLQYGWQPQVMAVHDRLKTIRAGDLELYDVVADPDESEDLADETRPAREVLEALAAYRIPQAATAGSEDPELSNEETERLAALGYVDWRGGAGERENAPAPRDMTELFADLDRGSAAFVRGDYPTARRLFERVLEKDPENLMVTVRLAVAHSLLGDEARATALFDRAHGIAPGSVDVRHYLAFHLLRFGHITDAGALLETVLADDPRRLPALEALARVRRGQGRTREAAALLERALAIEPDDAALLARLGELRMARADTAGALRAFEKARRLAGDDSFGHFLELGVLYLAARRPAEAREALDHVTESHPAYAMALFKRAQVSVLLAEPDREERVRLAYRRADEVTRPLIEREALFRGISLR